MSTTKVAEYQQRLHAIDDRVRDEGPKAWGDAWDLANEVIAELDTSTPDMESFIADCLAVCRARGWSLHWTARGAYLHLEASELIEAWRGKGVSTVAQEAGDVLLVLVSILGAAGVSWADAMECARRKKADLHTRPRYSGEEYSAGIADIFSKPATMGATTDAGTGDHQSPPLSSDGEVDGSVPEGESTTHNAGVAGSSPAPAIAGQGVTGSAAPSATTVATTGPDFSTLPHPYGGWL